MKSFSSKKSLQYLDESKLYEYLASFLVISKYHPEAFSDPQDLAQVDVDRGSTFGIDSIAFIINENLVISKQDIELYAKSKTLDVKIIFIQSKIEENYDTGSILKTFKAIESFLGDRKLLENNESIINAFEIYDELYDFKYSRFFNSRSPEILIYYITAGKDCENDLVFGLCEQEKKSIAKNSPEIKKISTFILGSNYIIDAFNELENRIEVQLNFKNNLSLDKIDKVLQSYLGYVSGADFLGIITDKQGNLRRKLFYENVRDFQGSGNSVNQEISKTITTKSLRDKFILLNNGITIVAKHFKSLGSNTYEMRDFQIVNGCQTSNEIFLGKEFSKEILIPLKIIHTTDLELISMIVKATNRQTPVPDEAFIALDRYHKLLQETYGAYSKEMPLQIFYERRSGEFDFLEKVYYQYQIVNLHSVIRAITSVYFQDAYVVYNNNPANILRSRFTRLFRDDHKTEIYYISNYLLALFVNFQEKGILARNDYPLRFYFIMITKQLLAGKYGNYDFSSKDIENEAKLIITKLKLDGKDIENAFIQAKRIITKAQGIYQGRRTNHNRNEILRDPEFNKVIINEVKKYLSFPSY